MTREDLASEAVNRSGSPRGYITAEHVAEIEERTATHYPVVDRLVAYALHPWLDPHALSMEVK
jgi:hypothetical protein